MAILKQGFLNGRVMIKLNTIRCYYNAVKFPRNPHKIHPIAHPLRRSMGCYLWFDALILILLQSTQCCMNYRVILEHVIRALDCIVWYDLHITTVTAESAWWLLMALKMELEHLEPPWWYKYIRSAPIRARFLSFARSKLRLCSANHRAGYFSSPWDPDVIACNYGFFSVQILEIAKHQSFVVSPSYITTGDIANNVMDKKSLC